MVKKSIPPIHNWSEYTPALINRGALTAWFDDRAREKWKGQQEGRIGRPRVYSDDAIQCVLIFRAVYRLPLRAAQGLVQSMFAIMGLELVCPNYTTLCRRAKTLKVRLPKLKRGEGLHLLFDSTGLKVYGSGEWMARKHGLAKRRGWKKLHIGLCADTQMVVVASTKDPVPRVDIRGFRRNVNSMVLLRPHWEANQFIDHEFQSPTFRPALGRQLSEFVDQQGGLL